jgi:hypothetical protein
VSKGPLAVEWGAPPSPSPQAGALELVQVELANAGSIPWGETVFVSYHWLDDRDNPIVWDGIRTRAPALAPGDRTSVEVRVRAPIPPGRYRLAFDLVAEHRAWFSELGSPLLARDVEVAPRSGEARTELPPELEPADGYVERVRAAHAEGYAVVAGAIEWHGVRRPRELAPYEPGGGRVPGFGAPLLVPSVLEGVELEPLGEVAGIPAFAAPQEEPWVYDGRIVVRARPRSGRQPR